MPLTHFVILAAIFGLALFAATSGILVVVATTWLWWAALLPLAISHWITGFLVTLRGSAANSMTCAVVSAAMTIFSIIAAACAAYGIELSMQRNVAVLVLIGASLAGLFGLALTFWQFGLWPIRSRQRPRGR
jgi:hypothetical protein